jgi:TRAP-type C4-dicarboxylate transport system permease small subunit
MKPDVIKALKALAAILVVFFLGVLAIWGHDVASRSSLTEAVNGIPSIW